MSTPKQIATRSDYVAFRTLQTRWMDNDLYGHLNNVVHYSLIDTAVSGWEVENGLLTMRDDPSYALVVETGCRYHAEIAFPDLVTAGLRVSTLGNSSARFEVGLFRNDEDRASAEGFFVHVFVERENHRPTRMDDTRRAALQTLMRP